jgi:hypothetical protein
MEHVDTQEVLGLVFRREMRGRGEEILDPHGLIAGGVADLHLPGLLRKPALHQVFGVLPQLCHVLLRNEVAHD